MYATPVSYKSYSYPLQLKTVVIQLFENKPINESTHMAHIGQQYVNIDNYNECWTDHVNALLYLISDWQWLKDIYMYMYIHIYMGPPKRDTSWVMNPLLIHCHLPTGASLRPHSTSQEIKQEQTLSTSPQYGMYCITSSPFLVRCMYNIIQIFFAPEWISIINLLLSILFCTNLYSNYNNAYLLLIWVLFQYDNAILSV